MNQPLTKRRGFTLAETIVSAAALTVIMAGMGSAILITNRSIPDLSPQGESRLGDTHRHAQQLLDEVRTATWVRSATTDALVFSVPDRDGDGHDERIQYSWDGKVGSALVRTYNDEESVKILPDVTHFTLNLERDESVETYPGPDVTQVSPTAHSYTTPGGTAFAVSDVQSLGVCYKPDFAREISYWKPGEISFATHTGSAQKMVKLYLQDKSGLPTGEPLETVLFSDMSLLKSFSWHTVQFVNCPPLSPDQGVCVVVNNGTTGSFAVETTAIDKSLHPEGFQTVSPGDEKAWEASSTHAMLFHAETLITTAGEDMAAVREYYTKANLSIQSGDNITDRIGTATPLLNRPEKLETFWEIDLEVDPTLDDRNVDGINDWNTADGRGGSVNVSDFVGQLQADGAEATFTTNPGSQFDTLTTVEVHMEALRAGGTGPMFLINADKDGSTVASFAVQLNRGDENTQTLSLFQRDPMIHHLRPMMRVEELSTGTQEVRLMIDPVVNTINLKINGAYQGTMSYTPDPAFSTPGVASIETLAQQGTFSFLSIRVGGNP
ncbi:MAG: type IV pilus modification PilV family protein [Phycisphaerae bacterium]